MKIFSFNQIIVLISTTIVHLVFALPAYAQNVPIESPVYFPDLETLINFFLGLIRPIVILVFVGTLMYGGWVYLNAKDDAGQTKKAKQIITASVIGFIIIVLAPVIVQLAGALLGIPRIFES